LALEEDKGTGTGSLSNHACYYHVLGTPQSEDKLIYSTPDHPVSKGLSTSEEEFLESGKRRTKFITEMEYGRAGNK
jgi:hypothetical protein